MTWDEAEMREEQFRDLFGSDTDTLKSRTEKKVKNIQCPMGGKDGKEIKTL